jgi:hypothetical protein
LTRNGSAESQMTAVGFLMGRGAGLAALEVSADNALEVASAAMNSECGLGTSFVEGGALDRLASVKGGAPAGFRSAAAAAAVAVARTCAAANNSECGLGTSFVEGGLWIGWPPSREVRLLAFAVL